MARRSLGFAKFWRFENLAKHQFIDPGGEATTEERPFQKKNIGVDGRRN
jgi:hypothetical protein